MADGNTLSPDHALIMFSRWDALSDDEQIKLPPLAPDVTVEPLTLRESALRRHNHLACSVGEPKRP